VCDTNFDGNSLKSCWLAGWLTDCVAHPYNRYETVFFLLSLLCVESKNNQVLIAAQEDAAGNLGSSAKRALLSIGAGTEEVAALGTHRRSSFAIIGRKGAKPGSVPQVYFCRARVVVLLGSALLGVRVCRQNFGPCCAH